MNKLGLNDQLVSMKFSPPLEVTDDAGRVHVVLRVSGLMGASSLRFAMLRRIDAALTPEGATIPELLGAQLVVNLKSVESVVSTPATSPPPK